MRVDHALDLGAQRFGFGGVDGDGDAAARHRHAEHVEGAAMAGDDRRHALAVGGAAVDAELELLARAVVEQFDAARDRRRPACFRPRRA